MYLPPLYPCIEGSEFLGVFGVAVRERFEILGFGEARVGLCVYSQKQRIYR